MRRSHPVVFAGLSTLIVLFSWSSLGGCPTGPGGGGGFNLPPTVLISVTPDPARGVPPLTIQFDSSNSSDDGVIVERLWDFGDGSETSPNIAPTHIYQAAGVYTVRLTLTDDVGAQASRTTEVTVTERPVAVIAVDRETAENAPATFMFDGSASFDPDAVEGDELLYRWDFGDGAIELESIIPHTFSRPGTYRVVLTVTDVTGVIGTAEKIIDVGIARPTIEFRRPPDSQVNVVCQPRSPLWVETVFNVEPGVPYTLRAGVDRDRDPCDAQTALFAAVNGAELHRLEGHDDAVRAAVFSPNSQFVLSAGTDGTARLYNVVRGTFLRTFASANTNPINALTFAPDSASIVLGRSDGTVRRFNTSDATLVRSYVGHGAAVKGLAFAAAGDRILSGDEAGDAILWNAVDGSELQRLLHPDGVTSVAFSPTNPTQLLTGCEDRIARIWNTSGVVLQQFAPVFAGGTLVAGHAEVVTSVSFSPDGTQILTGSADRTAKLWDVATGAELRTFTESGQNQVNSVAFSPDGTQVITGSLDGTARVWNAADATLVRRLTPCVSSITAVAFSPDGNTVLTGVAAQNAIQLDTDASDTRLVNDLVLNLPTPLDLANVPTGATGQQYFVWAELDTDRTRPVREYANPVINVVPAFPSDFSGTAPPVVPLVTNANGEDEVSAIAAPLTGSSNRQILDLGRLDLGDRIFLSLLTTPGYSAAFAEPGFSVMLLDAQEQLYAWYEDGNVLFSRDSKLIVGHTSNSYFVLLEGITPNLAPSVSVRVQRRFAADSQPRQQTVYLDFTGTGGQLIAVAGSAPFSLSPFVVDAPTDPVLQTGIQNKIETLFAPYNFVVLSSHVGDPEPTGPHITIYFDVEDKLANAILDRNGDGARDVLDLQFYGLSNFIDPRNETLSGRAVIDINYILATYPGLSIGQQGTTIGNVIGHHIGLLSGLRETTGVNSDIMTEDDSVADSSILDFTVADLAPAPGRTQIGIQNGPQLLNELFRN